MPVSRDDMRRWLGESYRLRSEVAEANDWRDASWRTEYLCRKAKTGNHFVYDEAAAGNKRLVIFARRKIE